MSAISKPTSAIFVESFRNAERLLTKARNIPEPDREKRRKWETELLLEKRNLVNWKREEDALVYILQFVQDYGCP